MSQTEEAARVVLSEQQQQSDIKHAEPKRRFHNLKSLIHKYCGIKNKLAKQFLAEILGTFILVVFGLGSIAQNTFNKNKSDLSVALSFGFGATSAAIIVGKISGCHINPAVSFAFLITGQMKILDYFIYVIAQNIGAFLGAFFIWLTYLDLINTKPLIETAGIFSTYPNDQGLTAFGGFFDQLIGTSLLVIVILALCDKNNHELPSGTVCIIVGFIITLTGTSFGFNCGGAVNPARDFSPRVFTAIAGWGSYPFTAFDYFFWVPLVGPMVGSLIGTLIYTLFISCNLE